MNRYNIKRQIRERFMEAFYLSLLNHYLYGSSVRVFSVDSKGHIIEHLVEDKASMFFSPYRNGIMLLDSCPLTPKWAEF